ncbi:MAG: dicarboxylate/amino acid:cation symporter [Acidobacteria bacterium]|nr:dicarboxylate/amino acid:cation symporter [Acidobacteriota bacterium]
MTAQILVGLVLGVVVGLLFPDVGVRLRIVSDIFLRLIRMIIVPLLFASLVGGLVGDQSFRKIGRLGLVTALFFLIATVVAFALAALAAVALRPGAGAPLTLPSPAGPISSGKTTFSEVVLNSVPASAVDAMARNDILQLVVFSIFFAVALSRIRRAQYLTGLIEDLRSVMMVLTDFVMRLAPAGVFAALAYALAVEGLDLVFRVARFVVAVYLGLALLVFGFFLLVSVLLRIRFGAFLKAAATPFLLAFSTCSSQSALPRALENMEAFGVPRAVAGFVLPAGYSFNLTGSYVYQVIALFFLIQSYGIQMSYSQLLLLVMGLMITSKGIATVPRASLVVLAATLTSFQLPLDGIAILLAVDQVLDMPRTGVNVIGNCLACVVVGTFGNPQSPTDKK